jgi:hypothetical protein
LSEHVVALGDVLREVPQTLERLGAERDRYRQQRDDLFALIEAHFDPEEVPWQTRDEALFNAAKEVMGR